MTLGNDPRLAPVVLKVTIWANQCLRKSDFTFSSHNSQDCHEHYLGRAFYGIENLEDLSLRTESEYQIQKPLSLKLLPVTKSQKKLGASH